MGIFYKIAAVVVHHLVLVNWLKRPTLGEERRDK